jgi:hypothetical protein
MAPPVVLVGETEAKVDQVDLEKVSAASVESLAPLASSVPPQSSQVWIFFIQFFSIARRGVF